MKFLNYFMLLGCVAFANATTISIDPNFLINKIFSEMIAEILVVQNNYNLNYASLQHQLSDIDRALVSEQVIEKKVNFLIQKDQLKTRMESLKLDNSADISKIRYLKGLQIIKILYEKVLGLDHHFASVRTFSEISKMANPNQYPEFEKVNELLKTKKEKKAGFDLTAVLDNNPSIL